MRERDNEREREWEREKERKIEWGRRGDGLKTETKTKPDAVWTHSFATCYYLGFHTFSPFCQNPFLLTEIWLTQYKNTSRQRIKIMCYFI